MAKKCELNEGEIMRISVSYDPKTGDINTEGKFHGNKLAMMRALIQICDEEFDMVCIPKDSGGGFIDVTEMSITTDEKDFEDFLLNEVLGNK